MWPPEIRRRICPCRNVLVALMKRALCNVLYIYTGAAPRCQPRHSVTLCFLVHLASPSGEGQLDYDGVLHEHTRAPAGSSAARESCRRRSQPCPMNANRKNRVNNTACARG